MSEENVAQHYRAAEAFSRQDLDGFLEICHPEIVLVSRHLELDGSGHLRGHESVRRWWLRRRTRRRASGKPTGQISE